RHERANPPESGFPSVLEICFPRGATPGDRTPPAIHVYEPEHRRVKRGTIVRTVARVFLSTAALGAALSVSAQNPSQTGDSELNEVIVTASRMGETAISRVPMSIVAETQKSLDELGIKTSQDLQRLVPSLRIGFNGGNGPPISIRGIQGNNAATTGVYLD